MVGNGVFRARRRSGQCNRVLLQLARSHGQIDRAGVVRRRQESSCRDSRYAFQVCRGLGKYLFAQDVGVSAVVGQLSQNLQVHPAKGARSRPVPGNDGIK